ncbi:MAG: response regulator receiver protein [Pedosphaera sp.]|nr:response regulator receiver protein [Pedosphaera sp.]
MVEDNLEDAEFFQRALIASRIANPVRHVENGLEAVAYLEGRGKYADRAEYPVPCVMFTDLKMPLMNGFELLEWLKDKPEFSLMPVIVFTSFKGEEVQRVYALKTDFFLAKTASLDDFIQSIRDASENWWWCERPTLQMKARNPAVL